MHSKKSTLSVPSADHIHAAASAVLLLLLLVPSSAKPLSRVEDGIVLCYHEEDAKVASGILKAEVDKWIRESNSRDSMLITSCPSVDDQNFSILLDQFANSYCPEVREASEIKMTQEPPVVGHVRCVCEGEDLPLLKRFNATRGSRCVQRSRFQSVLQQSRKLENKSLCAFGTGDPWLYRVEHIRVNFFCELQAP